MEIILALLIIVTFPIQLIFFIVILTKLFSLDKQLKYAERTIILSCQTPKAPNQNKPIASQQPVTPATKPEMNADSAMPQPVPPLPTWLCRSSHDPIAPGGMPQPVSTSIPPVQAEQPKPSVTLADSVPPTASIPSKQPEQTSEAAAVSGNVTSPSATPDKPQEAPVPPRNSSFYDLTTWSSDSDRAGNTEFKDTQKSPGNLESRSAEVFRKIWNYLTVGEESGNSSVTREYAVATTWLIRIGVIILLFGIGFFLKYSIDHNWITPAMRVLMMLGAGLAMTAIGIRKNAGKYRMLMNGLTGAGFVTLYLSIMAAFKLYHLVSAPLAFTFMALVTIAAMVTSLSLNQLFPAMLGCIGGFLTPVFISTGSHDPVKLFLYMTFLTAGTLFTAYYRSWLLLHLSAFLFYAVLGGTAISKYQSEAYAPWLLVLLTVNFTFFALITLGTARRRDATTGELLLLLANAAFYFSASIPIAQKYYAPMKIAAILPLWVIALGILQSLYASHKIAGKRPWLQMFLAFQTAFSVALVVPLLFGGVWRVTAWAILSYLMLRTAIRGKSRLLFVMSVILYGVTQFTLMRTYSYNYLPGSYASCLLNHFFGAGIMTASWIAAAVQLFRLDDFNWCVSSAETHPVARATATVFAFIAGICFLVYSSFEWHLCMKAFCPVFEWGILVLWWSLLILACVAVYRAFPAFQYVIPILLLLAVLAFCWIYPAKLPPISAGYGKHLLHLLLTRGAYVLSLAAAGMELYRSHTSKRYSYAFFAVAGILFFVFSSQEVYAVLKYYARDARNGGVTVWWALCASALLFNGIRRHLKLLRIPGMALFAVCALKVFFIDLANLGQIWRIVAFIVLGIVMLSGAIFYIRFKDFFAQDEEEK